MFDFPTAPANGTQVSSPSGATFVWDGIKWVSAGQARNKARLQAQWVSGTTVQNTTVYFYDMPYAGVVNSLKYFTGSGNFIVAAQIDGVSVAPLTALNVSLSTPTTVMATGANMFAAGQSVTFVITGATTAPAPTDALLSLAVTWS